VKTFEPYVQNLEKLASKLLSLNLLNPQDHLMIESALNGQPSKVLRSLVPVLELRQSGVFFTNRNLADRLASLIVPEIKRGIVLYDPACGAGDLLLACARHLPVSGDLETTLNQWNYRLRGADLYQPFTRATKIRLLLLAIERSSQLHAPSLRLEQLFPDIQVRDTLSSEEAILDNVCIVINPPYTMVETPKTCTWTSGLVSQAALYLEKYVKYATPGTKIAAILPDVLRTGTRYRKWRERIEQYAKIEEVELTGCFDPLTDVDTFICSLCVGKNVAERGGDWWTSRKEIDNTTKRVGDCFEVRVGPVVPHRHKLEGPLYPYIYAHQLPSWQSVEEISESRNFSGTTFNPPFVVVRRTSRPGDKYRAIGTIITGEGPVAVENHLIVFKPRSNSLEDCFQLMEVLRRPQTNDWLNERIRCRHLTVTAMQNLPWWKENAF
jgi:hypothetical protein